MVDIYIQLFFKNLKLESNPCHHCYYSVYHHFHCPYLFFLENVYPNPDSRPTYIAIDKACKLLRWAVTIGAWETWKQTSRFIVDTYHYNNHKASDTLCSSLCNPAPTDGTSPNLVTMTRDKRGRKVWKRAFNTQVSRFFLII